MLYLISLGLHDEKDMSLKALEAAKKCSSLYLELYTDPISVDTKKLEKLIGKKVELAERGDLEDRSKKLIDSAKNKDVGVLVGGDVLSATTHVSLAEEARKKDVKFQVIHGSSILTAVAETGLMIYKFGRVATLGDTLQKSVLDIIKDNNKSGLHSLILLDPGLKPHDALVLLENEFPKKDVIAAMDLGGDSSIFFGKIKELIKKKLGKVPAVVIVPGKLHFTEEEYIKEFSA